MQVLTRLDKTPETLRWLQQRALEDDTEEGRQDAIEILLRKYATVRGRELLELRGKVDWQGDVDELRERR